MKRSGQMGVPITPPTKAEMVFALASLAKPIESTGPNPNSGIQLGIKPIVKPRATWCGLDFSRNIRMR